MSLKLYKVLEATVSGSEVYLPKGAITLQPFMGEDGLMHISFLLAYEDWIKDHPADDNGSTEADEQETSEQETPEQKTPEQKADSDDN